jgi:outer membrane protein OmpA-like peptidoglycan-associated protein
LNENGEWDEPINLGSVINTPYCERTPFLHPDMKTLYFSSDGHGGLGGLDVYKSTRLADSCWNCWSEPVNLGKEINTESHDWGYKISTDGEKAYFSKGTRGEKTNDIYSLNLPMSMRPGMVATISGKLTNKANQAVEAEIVWEDLETGKVMGRSKADPKTGNYFVVLPLGKMYGYYVEKYGYYPMSDNVDLRKNLTPVKIQKDIVMLAIQDMIDQGIAVPITNLFFNTNESVILPYSIPELKRVAAIIKSKNLKVEISGHTDNVGDAKKNQTLSENRAAAVKDFLIKEGFDASMLSTKGYGATKPVADNKTEIGRAKNRRVELRIVK